MDKVHYTADGVAITPGLRVFTNNCRWGTVTYEDSPAYNPGWFWVEEDRDGRYGGAYLLNGERMSTRDLITGSTDPRKGG